MHLSRWLPFLNWPRPDAGLLRGEISAGLTVALVMVPQCVAYAALAGMPLIAGLYAAVLPPLIAVLFGSSTRLSVGPAALTCILTSSSLAGLAEPASPQWVMLAAWLALLSGAVQLTLGAIRFGWVLNLVSAPVLMGFTQAAALLIMASQLPALFGLSGPLSAASLQAPVDVGAAVFGLGSLTLLFLARRLAPRLPAMILVVGGAAIVSQLSGWSAHGAVIGTLPSGLPTPYWPGWPGWDMLSSLLVPSLVIALVSFLETASSGKIEAQRDGRRWNDNQDLLAQGLAKFASAFSGSFPTSTSFSRSAVTLYAGARTGWATISAVVFVVIALNFTSLLHHVPRAVLAAVVIAAVSGLLRPRALLRLWQVDRVETVTAVATFVVTLLASPRIHWGVLTGVLMGLAHFLYLRLHPRIIEVGLHGDGSLRDRHLWHLPPLAPDLLALRMDAALDFASASALEREVVDGIAAQPGLRHVCLFAQPINRIDATGAEVFGQLRRVLAERGIVLHLVGIKLPVENVLAKAGLLEPDALLRMYRTDADALAAFGTPVPASALADPETTP